MFQFPHDLAPEEYWVYSKGLAGPQTTPSYCRRRRARCVVRRIRIAPLPATTEIGKLPDLAQHPLRGRPAMANPLDQRMGQCRTGTMERGYGGRSIFFEGGNVREDLAPVSEYARMLASVGINGCDVNNVNGATPLSDAGVA